MASPLLLLLLLGGGAAVVAGGKKKPKAKSRGKLSVRDLPGSPDLDVFSRAFFLITRDPELKKKVAVLASTKLTYKEEYGGAGGLDLKEAREELANDAWRRLSKSSIPPPESPEQLFWDHELRMPKSLLYYVLLVGASLALTDYSNQRLFPEDIIWQYQGILKRKDGGCDWSKAVKAMRPANKAVTSSDAKLESFGYGIVHTDMDIRAFNAINCATAMAIEGSKSSSIKDKRFVPSPDLKTNERLWNPDKLWEQELATTFHSLVDYCLLQDLFGGTCDYAHEAASALMSGFLDDPELEVEENVELVFDKGRTKEELGLPRYGPEVLMWKDVRIGRNWWEATGRPYADKYLKAGKDLEEAALRLLTNWHLEEGGFYDWRLYESYPSYERYFEKHPEAGYDSYLKAVDDFNAKYPIVNGAMNAIMNRIAEDFDLKTEGIDWP